MIRPARAREAAALAEIARAAYAPYVPLLGFEPPPMRPDLPAAIAAGRVRVAGDPAEGFVIAGPDGADWHIENVSVAPARQGTGLGRALIAHAERLGRAAGFRRVTLYTNRVMEGPLALYPRLGYARTHEETLGRLHRVHFAKEL